MPVQSTEDRVDHDPQLRHRELYSELDHPVIGQYKFQNAPFKLSETPAVNISPAPMIGQHNQEIFEGLLGLTHDAFVAGYEDGTFWPTSLDRYPYMDEMIKSQPLPSAQTKRPSARTMIATKEGVQLGPLSGLRVLELADEKGQWCGKLMADLGAEVI